MTIEQVLKEWTERLMALPNVWSIGVGISKENQKPCIKVHVSERGQSIDDIPDEIQGYKVEIALRKKPSAL